MGKDSSKPQTEEKQVNSNLIEEKQNSDDNASSGVVIFTNTLLKFIRESRFLEVFEALGALGVTVIIILTIEFRGDKLSRNQYIVGIILALLGAFVISYKGNDTLQNMFVDGTQYVLMMAVTTTIITLIIKKNIQKVSPIVLVVNRTFFLFLFFVVSVLIFNESLNISHGAMQNIVIGSLLGPFLAAVSGYLALQYIPISQKAIFDSMRGLIVLIGAYLYFGKFPEPIAIMGGLISIVGVLFIAFGKHILNKKA